MTPTEMIEIIKAYEEGKDIEIWDFGKHKWIKCNQFNWNFGLHKYRVKQKEKVVYQYLYSDGLNPPMYRASIGFYETIEKAQSYLTHPLQVIRRLDYTKTIIEE